jgi:RHS repeat-associated protein
MKDHLGNTRATYAEACPGVPQVSEYNHYYPFGMQLEALCYSSGEDLLNNNLYNGKELQPDYGLQWYDYGARFYDPEIGRWHVPDPVIENNHFENSPYTYVYNNPILFIDTLGLDSVYFFDQAKNPNNRRTYTAEVFHIKTGKLVNSETEGSTYPNYPDTKTGSQNTVTEGEHDFNNKWGHNKGQEKGLNIDDSDPERIVSGTKPDGTPTKMHYADVHKGDEETNRGSAGCPTIRPKDADVFFSNFDWSKNDIQTKGNSTGKVFISRGDRSINRKYNELKAMQNRAIYDRIRHVYIMYDK